MYCLILGSGGSNGVPQIGCNCYVCTSNSKKNKRLRPGIFIKTQETSILVDSGPDIRQQMITHNISDIDKVFYTHHHSDHTMGIDDLKLLRNDKNPIDTYMNQETYNILLSKFEYIFHTKNPLYLPILKAKIIKPFSKFKIKDIEVEVLNIDHRYNQILGFKFNDLVYTTDVYNIEEKTLDIISKSKYWIIDTARYAFSPTHSFLEKTLNWIEYVKPEKAILTHMNHEIEYYELKKLLPENVLPAYDGMKLDL